MLSAGIIFDATYSGKAFHALREDIRADPAYWKGRKVTRNSTLTNQLSLATKSFRFLLAAIYQHCMVAEGKALANAIGM